MIRKATLRDSDFIYTLVKRFADDGKMLYRSLNEIYENIRDYFIVEENSKQIGCGALNICWKDLAEIKSLAIEEEWQRKGIGKLIVENCIKEAKDLGINKIFAFTYQPEFFKKLGFKEEDKNNMPKKIWSDCIKCAKFSECDEHCLSIMI